LPHGFYIKNKFNFHILIIVLFNPQSILIISVIHMNNIANALAIYCIAANVRKALSHSTLSHICLEIMRNNVTDDIVTNIQRRICRKVN
jgi:hypothetical protein